MKKLIVLPGNSPRNKMWGEETAAYFGGMFDAVYTQSYDHWESGEKVINFDAEADKLKREVAADDGQYDYYIFGKSFGSILALMSVYKGCVRPARCVFFGLPFNIVANDPDYKDNWSFLESFSVPAIAFHNEHDPTADYAFTKAKLEELNISSIDLVVTDGDTHVYDQYEAYIDHIKAFCEL